MGAGQAVTPPLGGRSLQPPISNPCPLLLFGNVCRHEEFQKSLSHAFSLPVLIGTGKASGRGWAVKLLPTLSSRNLGLDPRVNLLLLPKQTSQLDVIEALGVPQPWEGSDGTGTSWRGMGKTRACAQHWWSGGGARGCGVGRGA